MRERNQEIKRRRQRKAKLAKLRGQYAGATNSVQKKDIADKIRRVSVYATPTLA